MHITPTVVFSLLSCLLFISIPEPRRIPGSPDEKSVIASIEIFVETIQRDRKHFQIQNLTNGDADWIWRVYDAETGKQVAVSHRRSPGFRLPRGAYDLLVTAKGKNELVRHFRRHITVLPSLFSEDEADEVIDLSKITGDSYIKDYRGEPRPGYRIILKGTYHGRIKISGLHGTPERPVHIINNGQVEMRATNNTYPFAWLWGDDNHYILIDGKGDPNVPFGMKLVGHPEKPGQILFLGGKFNKGFEIAGLHLVGNKETTEGGAAIQVQTTFTEDCHAENWNFEFLKIHHTKIENAASEGMYLGYFTDEKRDTGFAPYRLGKVLVYMDTIINSGWDAIQIASADQFEVHNNYVDGASLSGKRNHSSFISWNNGNIEGYCYRNTFKNSAHAATIIFGETGRDAYIYSNLFIEGTFPSAINTPGFFFTKAYNEFEDVRLFIFHNTIVTSRISAKVDYRRTKPTGEIPIIYAANAILQNRINDDGHPEIAMGRDLADSTSWVIDNVWRLERREKDLRWNSDYRPKRGSPLLKIDFDITEHLTKLKGGFYDRDGYPLKHDEVGYTSGCFSAHQLDHEDGKAISHGIH